MKEMQRIKVARAIIFNEKNEVLLGKRAKGVGAGLMELPGGKVDPGEEPQIAVVREVREEMGLAVTSAELVEEYEDNNQEIIYKNFLYLSKAEGTLRLNDEVLSAGFFSENEIVLFDMAFQQKDHLLEILEKRKRGEI